MILHGTVPDLVGYRLVLELVLNRSGYELVLILEDPIINECLFFPCIYIIIYLIPISFEYLPRYTGIYRALLINCQRACVWCRLAECAARGY